MSAYPSRVLTRSNRYLNSMFLALGSKSSVLVRGLCREKVKEGSQWHSRGDGCGHSKNCQVTAHIRCLYGSMEFLYFVPKNTLDPTTSR